MRKLAGVLRTRLVSLASAGVFIERVDVVDNIAAPLVRAHGNDLMLAGDAAALRDLAAALADEHPAAPAGIDALAAHALTVLNAAHETVTDDVERAGLGHLLARPG